MQRMLCAILLYAGMLTASSGASIEDYVPSRDKVAIVSMLKDDAKFLGYDGNEACTIWKVETDLSRTKVIRKNDTTVGFCSYEKYPPHYSGCIYLIAVDKKHRKHGYASKLIQSALDDFDAKKIEEVEICVHRENESALALYQKKFGFKFAFDRDENFKTLFRPQVLKSENWFSWWYI